MSVARDRTTKGLTRVSEAAKFLAVSRAKVYQMMTAGELDYVKLGKSRRVPWDAVEAVVEKNTVRGAATN